MFYLGTDLEGEESEFVEFGIIGASNPAGELIHREGKKI